MRISVELVPRSRASLASQLDELADVAPDVDTVNIPDVLRFDVRSWDACAQASARVAHTIPHIRAMDVDVDRPFPQAAMLREAGIDELLVVTGDAPTDMAHPVYGSTSVQVIRKLRSELPDVTLYAAFDPYRQGFRAEHDYVQQKLDAGASALFTQPFFDVRLMEIWAELLEGIPIYWGVTSVTTAKSARYWRSRNRAVLPADFEPSLAWNRAFAREALDFVRRRDGNIYFMPIRASIREYLGGLFDG